MPVCTALEFAALAAIEVLGVGSRDVAGLFVMDGGGVVVGWGSAPSLCLSSAGGEIGVSRVFFLRLGEIGGRFETGTYRGRVDRGRIGVGVYGHVVRLGEASELFQVLEVLEDRFQKFAVVLGCCGRLWVVVVAAGIIVVPRGAAATGGAVLFGHVGTEEHHQEGRRGVGLLGPLEEHDFEHVGVPEDGYFQPLVEAEGIVGLPLPSGTDGHARIIGGEADDTGLGEYFEIYGLKYPGLAVFGGEVAKLDTEVAFEFGGLVVGADTECLEGGWHWEERRRNCVRGRIVHEFLWCQVGGFTAEGAGSAEGRSWDFTLSQDGRGDKSPSPPYRGWGAGFLWESHDLRRVAYVIENGLSLGKGNHEGCPYGRIAGVYFRGNGRGLRKVTYVIESGLAPGTGNHEGCPYGRFAGVYFRGNRHGLREVTYVIESGLAPGTGKRKGWPYGRFAGVYFRGNRHGLREVTYVIESGLAPGTGKRKGWPYGRFAESILMVMAVAFGRSHT